MSQFAVQVHPLEDIRGDEFSRFALKMAGMQTWDVEQASFGLRVGYVYFGTRSDADDAAARLSGSSLNGVALQFRSVVLVDDDFGFVGASPAAPEPAVERRRSDDRPAQRPEPRSAPVEANSADRAPATTRSESGHRHRHRHRKASSYSSSSYSSSSDSPDERSRPSHRSHRSHHRHHRHRRHRDRK
jgi:hypothetical protein